MSAEVSSSSPDWHGLSSTLTVSGARLTSGPSLGADAATGSGVLSLNRGTWGGWISGGGESVWRAQPSFATPLLASGLWRQLRSVVIELSATRREARLDQQVYSSSSQIIGSDSVLDDTTGRWQHYPISRYASDTSTVTRARAWTETEGRISWSHGVVALDGVLGIRPGTDILPHEAWGYADASIHLAGPFALELGGGARREAIAGPESVRRFATVAVRLSPSRGTDQHGPSADSATTRGSTSAFSLKRVDAGKYVVSVRLPAAGTVELSGDFNGWQPVSLEQTRPGIWEAQLALAAGTHQVNIRIDGAQWIAPPGIPTVADEFKGAVGIVVVR